MSFDESKCWDFSPEPIGLESEMEEFEEPVFKFITAADEHVCPKCGPLDCQVFTASEVESNFPDASELFPGIVAANVHIRCRCQLIGEPMDESATDSLGSSEEFFGGEY
jgi:hypothetical protein